MAAPQINVECTTPRCNEYGKVQTVDAGVLVTPTVLAAYSLCCAVCGNQLLVTGSAG